MSGRDLIDRKANTITLVSHRGNTVTVSLDFWEDALKAGNDESSLRVALFKGVTDSETQVQAAGELDRQVMPSPCQALGCTLTELLRWTRDGKIPVLPFPRSSFVKGFQRVYYDPDGCGELAPADIAKFRESDELLPESAKASDYITLANILGRGWSRSQSRSPF